jgi:hypothetical protein
VRQSPAGEAVALAAAGGDAADREKLVHAVVNCWVCELAMALWLLVVTICGCSQFKPCL